MSVQVLSHWQVQPKNAGPATDEERHAVFSRYATGMANIHMPWLMPLLDKADATLYVAPSVFAFQLPDGSGRWLDVPEMARLIPMVPWVDPTDTQQ